MPLLKNGKAVELVLSQKTCRIKQTNFSFRVKGMRCKGRRTFIFLSHLHEGSHTKNSSIMRKISFVLAAVIISNQLGAQDTTRVTYRRIETLTPGVSPAALENVV